MVLVYCRERQCHVSEAITVLFSSRNSCEQTAIGLKKDSGLKIEFELCEFHMVNCQYYKKCQILPKKSFQVISRQTKI